MQFGVVVFAEARFLLDGQDAASICPTRHRVSTNAAKNACFCSKPSHFPDCVQIDGDQAGWGLASLTTCDFSF